MTPVKRQPDPVGPLVLETVCGFGLFDEEWVLRIAGRSPTTQDVPADAFDWEVTSLEYEVVEGDGWNPWGLRGPLTITHLAILREDTTPIDAREIDPIVVPKGRSLDSVTCDIRLLLP